MICGKAEVLGCTSDAREALVAARTGLDLLVALRQMPHGEKIAVRHRFSGQLCSNICFTDTQQSIYNPPVRCVVSVRYYIFRLFSCARYSKIIKMMLGNLFASNTW
jgi:hypothetical protein